MTSRPEFDAWEWLPSPQDQLAQDVRDALQAKDAPRALEAYLRWEKGFSATVSEVTSLMIDVEITPFLKGDPL